ncbi:MAG: metalloregulator ArsR/SmtB family transcription factor [Pseudomonadota bacterium]
MKSQSAVEALSAMAQESRLAIFRMLVKRGPEGFAAGEIAERLGIPSPNLSFHLKALDQADLVLVRKAGRFIYYSANYDRMNDLVAYLTENCCGLGTANCAPACLPAPAIKQRKSA